MKPSTTTTTTVGTTTANYGAVPVVEAFDIPMATVIQGTPSVVRVVAPTDLVEGYECPVKVLGHRMVATVVRPLSLLVVV